jgi:hypothetical protein
LFYGIDHKRHHFSDLTFAYLGQEPARYRDGFVPAPICMTIDHPPFTVCDRCRTPVVAVEFGILHATFVMRLPVVPGCILGHLQQLAAQIRHRLALRDGIKRFVHCLRDYVPQLGLPDLVAPPCGETSNEAVQIPAPGQGLDHAVRIASTRRLLRLREERQTLLDEVLVPERHGNLPRGPSSGGGRN